ncbi:hypothetical protein MAUB1S_01827 [Mycolicibacterium aubagnense]
MPAPSAYRCSSGNTLIGLHLHWLILPLTFIVLVAVGSDYNLLLVARLKEEIHAGLNTGLIRALGSTGGVVTSAGLVFAFTMLAMLSSDLRTIGQMGSTVCIGLLLDTLVVRSFIVPCLVRLLGPWFWWPTFVRQRPLQPYKRGSAGGPTVAGDTVGIHRTTTIATTIGSVSRKATMSMWQSDHPGRAQRPMLVHLGVLVGGDHVDKRCRRGVFDDRIASHHGCSPSPMMTAGAVPP